MDTERYPHAVATYLRGEGWETSGTRVQEDVFAIVARQNGADSEQRVVVLAVADEASTVEQRHLNYLRKAANKKDADRMCVTTQGSLSATAQSIVENYDVTVLDSETVIAAVTDGTESTAEQNATGPSQQSSQQQHSQPQQPEQRHEQKRQPQPGGQTRGRQSHRQPGQTQHAVGDLVTESVARLRRLEVPENSKQRLRSAVGNAPLRGGAFRGVGVYVTGLIFAALLHVLVTGPQVDALFAPGARERALSTAVGGGSGLVGSVPASEQFPSAVVEGAWLLYSAQGVSIVGTVLPVDGNLIAAAVDGNINQAVAQQYRMGLSNSRPGAISELGQLFVGFRLLYLVVPFLLFTEAYRLVGSAYDEGASLEDQAVGGASLLVGYLPVVVAGTFLFARDASPALGSAIVMAGIGQPLVYGTAGGVTAAVLRGSDASLRQGGYYGLAAFCLAGVGTFVLTYISGGLGIAEIIVATLTLLGHAAALAFPPADRLLPGMLYYVVVVAALAVVGRWLVRPYRGSKRSVDAAKKGSTLAVGFGAGLFATLFVVLVFLVSFDAAIFGKALGLGAGLTAEEAIPIHPVRTVFVGGILLPALVGGGIGAYLAEV